MTQELVDNVPPTSVSLLLLMTVLGVPWDALGCHSLNHRHNWYDPKETLLLRATL